MWIFFLKSPDIWCFFFSRRQQKGTSEFGSNHDFWQNSPRWTNLADPQLLLTIENLKQVPGDKSLGEPGWPLRLLTSRTPAPAFPSSSKGRRINLLESKSTQNIRFPRRPLTKPGLRGREREERNCQLPAGWRTYGGDGKNDRLYGRLIGGGGGGAVKGPWDGRG